MHYDERNREILDDTPVSLPIGFRRPPTLQETIRALVRTEVSKRAANEGLETFEEADDFNVGDDYDPTSPWELDYDQESEPLARSSAPAATEERPVDKAKADGPIGGEGNPAPATKPPGAQV